MAIKIYESFTKGGSVNFPCIASTKETIGVELSVTAQNLVGGYERLLRIVLGFKAGNDATYYHMWAKNYNHYMRAGSIYTFVSQTQFPLPANTYIVGHILVSDGLNAGALPIVPSPDIIPQVY